MYLEPLHSQIWKCNNQSHCNSPHYEYQDVCKTWKLVSLDTFKNVSVFLFKFLLFFFHFFSVILRCQPLSFVSNIEPCNCNWRNHDYKSQNYETCSVDDSKLPASLTRVKWIIFLIAWSDPVFKQVLDVNWCRYINLKGTFDYESNVRVPIQALHQIFSFRQKLCRQFFYFLC